MAISGVLDFPASTGGHIRLALYPAPPRKGGRQLPVLVHNLSSSGMLLETSHALNIGDKVETVFAEAAVALGEITWTGVKLFGCQFDHSVAAELLEQAVSRVLRQEQAENTSMSQTVDTFGARLQRLRMAKGLHQVDIAERLGVTAVAISNWESDRSQPRQHRIAELAKILGVPSQQLATNAVVLPETLPEVLASSKAQVANLLGVTPASVKIIVDL